MLLPTSSPKVLVIGGGLGGLCLAQGLRAGGIDVAVYERDPSPLTRNQGYRIHIDARGEAALHACLPQQLYQVFLATRGQPSRQATRFQVVGQRLEAVSTWRFPEHQNQQLITAGSAVDRLTLREILLAGLEISVHFGKEFVRYDHREDGRVRAVFTDGTSAIGDLLVGADGVNSRVRQQLLPQAQVADTGLRWLGGKTLLTHEIRSNLPPQLHDGFGFVQQAAHFFILGPLQFRRDPNEVAAELWPGLRFHATADYVMWALVAHRDHLGASDQELEALPGPELRRFILARSADWPALLRTLVEHGEEDQGFVLKMRTAVPIEQWPTSNVTLLGDAIHAMPPSRGSGGNTALRDASLLAHNLQAVILQGLPLEQAIHEYEVAMVRYGFAAVRASLQPAGPGMPVRAERRTAPED